MVEAAFRAVRRHGPAVGMDEIAAEAGVSKPILYRQFADKADLYLAVGQRAAAELLAELDAQLDRPRQPRQHVAAVVDTYLAFIEREPQLYRFVASRAFADRPVHPDPIAGYSELVAVHLARILGDRLRAAGVDAGPAEPWAYGIVGMVQAAGDWWLNRPAMSRRALTGYLTALIWGGFAGVQGTAAQPRSPAPLRVVDEPPRRRRGTPPG